MNAHSLPEEPSRVQNYGEKVCLIGKGAPPRTEKQRFSWGQSLQSLEKVSTLGRNGLKMKHFPASPAGVRVYALIPLMAKRTFRLSAAFALIVPAMPFTASLSEVWADNSPPPQASARIEEKPAISSAKATSRPATTVATRKQKSRKQLRRKNNGPSPFVRLSRRIIDDTLICSDQFEWIGPMVDSGLNGCLAGDQRLKWALATDEEPRIECTEGPFVELEEGLAPRLMIHPLHLYLGGYTPLFKQFFTPLGQSIYLSVGELAQNGDSWLRKQDWLEGGRTDSTLDRFFAADTVPDSAPFSYRYSMDRKTAFIAGVGWIYDITDTVGMSQAFAQAGYDTPEKVGAVNLTIGYNYSAFTLTGGYIHAVEGRDNLANFSQNGQENDPTAWSSQLAYNTDFLDRPATLAVGYQKSSETLAHYLPEERYTTKAAILLRGRTTLSLEYYQDREYSRDNSLDDDETYGITTKIGFQF